MWWMSIPAYSEEGLRISFWGDEIETLEIFDIDTETSSTRLMNSGFIRHLTT
jgi:transcription-repair coupling factor (superfamily II helicase)